VCAEYADGRPACIVGPCWPMYLVTCLLVAGGTAGVLGGLGRESIPVLVVGSVLGAITLVGAVGKSLSLCLRFVVPFRLTCHMGLFPMSCEGNDEANHAVRWISCHVMKFYVIYVLLAMSYHVQCGGI
jgi:hypothetical protein